MAYRGARIAQWVEDRFSHLAENLGHRIAQKIREFTAGLNTIHGPFEFFQLSAVSVLMWWVIAVAYKEVTHAYGAPMASMSIATVLPLMFCSLARLSSCLEWAAGLSSRRSARSTTSFILSRGNSRPVAASCCGW
jgi:hypothetical protein